MQIWSVCGQTESAHRLNINGSLCKSTHWQQITLYMEKLNYSCFCELRTQSSIVIRNTSFRYYMKRRWIQNAIESFLKTVRATFIIISLIYSLSTLLTLRPKGKIGHFHILCLFDCKIITECTIFKCKVSFILTLTAAFQKSTGFDH